MSENLAVGGDPVAGGELLGCGEPVRNGDLWRVRQVHPDGSLTLSGTTHRGTLIVDADYTRTHRELGYAATVHRAQSMTVDRAHLLADTTLTRAGVYVGLTRGREANHHPGGLTEDTTVDPREVFARILARGVTTLPPSRSWVGAGHGGTDRVGRHALEHHRLALSPAPRCGRVRGTRCGGRS